MVDQNGQKGFFPELVGLRAYLALWVALGHGLQKSGIVDAGNPLLRLLVEGTSAVFVFMIMSGFVIAHLIIEKDEPYPQYIVRRFFRLYPIFVVACLGGYMLSGAADTLMNGLPWRHEAALSGATLRHNEMAGSYATQLLAHVAMHATMLHGLVPREVFPFSADMFVGPGWSISLEWQFYLIAPAVMVALRTARGALSVALASFLLMAAYNRGLFGTFDLPSMLAPNALYFLAGIASRLALPHLKRFDWSPLTASAFALLVVTATMNIKTAIIIWAVFYAFMLWSHRAAHLGGLFRAMTLSRPVQQIGEASFSLYLIHDLVQIAVGRAVLPLVSTKAEMFVAMIAAIGIAIGLSLVTYRFVELPGMDLGRRIARDMRFGSIFPTKSLSPASRVNP